MRKFVCALVLCVSVMLTACQTQKAETEKQLIMVYMVGSDLESEAGMASHDLTEILESNFDEESLDVLICTGGTDYWWTEEISNEECAIYRVTEGVLHKLHILDNSNMASPVTLTEFLDYGYNNSDATDYSLIMWNHGGGAILGFGADEKHEYDSLSLQEMDTAFANSQLVVSGEKFKWIGFDACLMAMLEVANVMSDYSDYMIASEELEAREGWNYDFLEKISANASDGEKAAQAIIDAYRNYYETNYKYVPDFTMSCIDLSKTDEVMNKLDNLVEVVSDALYSNEYSRIAKMRDNTKSFGKISSEGFYDTVDLYDLAENMSSIYPEEVEDLQASLEDMVIYMETNVYDAHGMAIYFPYENKKYSSEWIATYETTGFSQKYIDFLKKFTDILSGVPLIDWATNRMIPTKSEDIPNEYYVQLTQEQYDNLGHSKYSIWQEDSPGSYICWINSSDVSVTEGGKIFTAFDGKRFYIGDTSGNSLECCAIEVERNSKYIKYAIPLMHIPKDDKQIFWESAYLHYRFNIETFEGEVIGIYKEVMAESTLFPNRNTTEIKEGDIISPLYWARKDMFLEDGTIALSEQWTSKSGVGRSFIVNGELEIAFKKPEEVCQYMCLIGIHDTQGNSYYAEPIYINYE